MASLLLSNSDHQTTASAMFEILLEDMNLSDITLLTEEGKLVDAHKIVLSASSKYFKSLFSKVDKKYPVIVLRGVSFVTLKHILEFIYLGEARIDKEKLENFLEVGKSLQINGIFQ